MTSQSPTQRSVYSSLILIQVLFATSYIISKVLMESFSPPLWAFLRSAGTALLMIALAVVLKRPRPPFQLKFLGPLTLYSLLGGVLTQGLFLAGLHETTATNSAIIYALTPILTLLIVILRKEETLSIRRGVGFFLSLSGVFILCRVENFTLSQKGALGNLYTLLSCSSYAAFLALSKRFFNKFDQIWITAGMFSISTLGFGLWTHLSGSGFNLPPVSFTLGIAILYGIVFATLLAYFLVIWAVSHAPASQVALFGYLQTLLTSLIAWAYFREEIDLRTLISGGLILVGVTSTLEFRKNYKLLIKRFLTMVQDQVSTSSER